MFLTPNSDLLAQRVVVIGSGHAGVQVADALRALGHSGSVSIVGEEPLSPYHRPPLSKGFLAGSETPATMALRSPQYFEDRNIDLHTGATAVAIDRQARTVTLADGRELRYDRLVLATGAANRALAIPGADLAGIYSLRSLADADRFRAGLRQARSMVIVGAGFIGLEVAATARGLGVDVTVLEANNRPMARALSTPMSEYLSASHQRSGVNLRAGEAVAAFTGEDGRVTGVSTQAGERHRADMVLAAVGVTPRVELAAAAGLPVRDGIVVDENLRTADAAIFAVGDCANHPNVHAGRRTRLESVQNATDQARHVAAAIHGVDDTYTDLPWFWSHQGELKLQIAGVCDSVDECIVLGEPATGRFSVCLFKQGRLCVVESLNRPSDHMAARRLLEAGRSPRPEHLHNDPSFSLKAFAQQPAAGR
jgi:3-phenylpropionate/trans-cinnamate dioxygenase ferredoxin reductase component